MHYSVLKRKIVKRLDKLRFLPLEVFVFHVVSDCFDPNCNIKDDWISTADFKQRIEALRQCYTFIPLDLAYRHLQKDCLRNKRLAVLTCDDGFASIIDILPYLEKEQIPISLFINPKYLDGNSVRHNYAPNPQYITHEQLFALTSPLLSIGMHGYEHLDATQQTPEAFADSVDKCIDILSTHPRFMPFFAYTWGNHNEHTDRILASKNVVPVLCDGAVNYRYHHGISRRPIDMYEL